MERDDKPSKNVQSHQFEKLSPSKCGYVQVDCNFVDPWSKINLPNCSKMLRCEEHTSEAQPLTLAEIHENIIYQQFSDLKEAQKRWIENSRTPKDEENQKELFKQFTEPYQTVTSPKKKSEQSGKGVPTLERSHPNPDISRDDRSQRTTGDPGSTVTYKSAPKKTFLTPVAPSFGFCAVPHLKLNTSPVTATTFEPVTKPDKEYISEDGKLVKVLKIEEPVQISSRPNKDKTPRKTKLIDTTLPQTEVPPKKPLDEGRRIERVSSKLNVYKTSLSTNFKDEKRQIKLNNEIRKVLDMMEAKKQNLKNVSIPDADDKKEKDTESPNIQRKRKSYSSSGPIKHSSIPEKECATGKLWKPYDLKVTRSFIKQKQKEREDKTVEEKKRKAIENEEKKKKLLQLKETQKKILQSCKRRPVDEKPQWIGPLEVVAKSPKSTRSQCQRNRDNSVLSTGEIIFKNPMASNDVKPQRQLFMDYSNPRSKPMLRRCESHRNLENEPPLKEILNKGDNSTVGNSLSRKRNEDSLTWNLAQSNCSTFQSYDFGILDLQDRLKFQTSQLKRNPLESTKEYTPSNTLLDSHHHHHRHQHEKRSKGEKRMKLSYCQDPKGYLKLPPKHSFWKAEPCNHSLDLLESPRPKTPDWLRELAETPDPFNIINTFKRKIRTLQNEGERTDGISQKQIERLCLTEPYLKVGDLRLSIPTSNDTTMIKLSDLPELYVPNDNHYVRPKFEDLKLKVPACLLERREEIGEETPLQLSPSKYTLESSSIYVPDGNQSNGRLSSNLNKEHAIDKSNVIEPGISGRSDTTISETLSVDPLKLTNSKEDLNLKYTKVGAIVKDAEVGSDRLLSLAIPQGKDELKKNVLVSVTPEQLNLEFGIPQQISSNDQSQVTDQQIVRKTFAESINISDTNSGDSSISEIVQVSRTLTRGSTIINETKEVHTLTSQSIKPNPSTQEGISSHTMNNRFLFSHGLQSTYQQNSTDDHNGIMEIRSLHNSNENVATNSNIDQNITITSIETYSPSTFDDIPLEFSKITSQVFKELAHPIREADEPLKNMSYLKAQENKLAKTKSNIAHMEAHRLKLIQSGKEVEASILKKKERALMLKFQTDLEEIIKLRKLEKAAARQKKNQQLLEKMFVTSPSQKRETEHKITKANKGVSSSALLPQGKLLPEQRSPDFISYTTRELKEKEELLRCRRKNIEAIVAWKHRLDQEERKVREMESIIAHSSFSAPLPVVLPCKIDRGTSPLFGLNPMPEEFTVEEALQQCLSSQPDAGNEEYSDSFELSSGLSERTLKNITIRNKPGSHSPNKKKSLSILKCLLSPRATIIKRGHSSGSDDSVTLSQNDTLSEHSDMEVRVSALRQQLRQRKTELEKLRKEFNKNHREKLRAKEQSLINQIQAYDNYIEEVKEKLQKEMEKTDIKVMKPQIKQPKFVERRKSDLAISSKREKESMLVSSPSVENINLIMNTFTFNNDQIQSSGDQLKTDTSKSPSCPKQETKCSGSIGEELTELPPSLTHSHITESVEEDTKNQSQSFSRIQSVKSEIVSEPFVASQEQLKESLGLMDITEKLENGVTSSHESELKDISEHITLMSSQGSSTSRMKEISEEIYVSVQQTKMSEMQDITEAIENIPLSNSPAGSHFAEVSEDISEVSKSHNDSSSKDISETLVQQDFLINVLENVKNVSKLPKPESSLQERQSSSSPTNRTTISSFISTNKGKESPTMESQIYTARTSSEKPLKATEMDTASEQSSLRHSPETFNNYDEYISEHVSPVKSDTSRWTTTERSTSKKLVGTSSLKNSQNDSPLKTQTSIETDASLHYTSETGKQTSVKSDSVKAESIYSMSSVSEKIHSSYEKTPQNIQEGLMESLKESLSEYIPTFTSEGYKRSISELIQPRGSHISERTDISKPADSLEPSTERSSSAASLDLTEVSNIGGEFVLGLVTIEARQKIQKLSMDEESDNSIINYITSRGSYDEAVSTNIPALTSFNKNSVSSEGNEEVAKVITKQNPTLEIQQKSLVKHKDEAEKPVEEVKEEEGGEDEHESSVKLIDDTKYSYESSENSDTESLVEDTNTEHSKKLSDQEDSENNSLTKTDVALPSKDNSDIMSKDNSDIMRKTEMLHMLQDSFELSDKLWKENLEQYKKSSEETPLLSALQRERQQSINVDYITQEVWGNCMQDAIDAALNAFNKKKLYNQEKEYEEESRGITIGHKENKENEDFWHEGLSPQTVKEAHELHLKQLQIEQEIEELEAQEAMPFYYVREIPNKPPPPYTPPRQNPPTKEETIARICEGVEILWDEQINNGLAPPSVTMPSNFLSNVQDRPYREFMFDLAKEIFVKFRPLPEETKPPWQEVNRPKKPLPPIKSKSDLLKHVEREIKLVYGHEPKVMRENMIMRWTRKKRDLVDEILVRELQEEEHEWTNFAIEECMVKNQIAEELIVSMMAEAALSLGNAFTKKFKIIDAPS